MAVIRTPRRARRTVIPHVIEGTGSAREPLKEKHAYQCGIIVYNDFAFCRPMKAMKRPIPTETACFNVIGMELKIASRTLVRESRMKIIPSANTATRACSQEYPMPRTTVYANKHSDPFQEQGQTDNWITAPSGRLR